MRWCSRMPIREDTNVQWLFWWLRPRGWQWGRGDHPGQMKFNVVFYNLKKSLMNKVSNFIVDQMFIIMWYFSFIICHSSFIFREEESEGDSPILCVTSLSQSSYFSIVMSMEVWKLFCHMFTLNLNFKLLRDPIYQEDSIKAQRYQ